MRPPFFRESRLVIVAGKGGVGKTTVAAVTAAAAAASGLRTLLVALDASSTLAPLFGIDRVDHHRTPLADGLDGQVIEADRALHEWLSDKRMGKLADRLAGSGALDMIATAVPGIHDILVLGRIKAIVNEGRFDLVVVDGPASGHAVTMLHTADGLRDSVTVGAIRQQADEVAAMLADPALTQVVLVTLAETTPVTETIETAFALEEQVGVRLGPIIANHVHTPLADSIDLRSLRGGLKALVTDRASLERAQRSELVRLRSQLPLQVIELPAVLNASAVERRDQLQQALMSGLS